MNIEYRSQLIATVNYLIHVRHTIFGETLNLAMLGDLKEINDSFDEGDVYKFELAHLKDLPDVNVERMVSLIEQIQTTIDLVIVDNKLEEDELQFDGMDRDGES